MQKAKCVPGHKTYIWGVIIEGLEVGEAHFQIVVLASNDLEAAQDFFCSRRELHTLGVRIVVHCGFFNARKGSRMFGS